MIDLLDENGNKYIHVKVDRTTKYEILGYIDGNKKRRDR